MTKGETIRRVPSLRSQMLMSAAAIAMGVTLFGASNEANAQTINWSGFYVGGDLGYGGSRFKSTISQPGEDKTAKGFVGGVHAGYNWQMGSLVLGGEVDFSATGISTNISDNHFKTDVLASLRGRLGFAFNQILIYGTGGVGVAHGKVYSSDSSTSNKRFNKVRPVLGAGAEYALNNNFSLRAEFLDYIGSNTKLPNEDSGGNKLGNIWVTRVGFSYKF